MKMKIGWFLGALLLFLFLFSSLSSSILAAKSSSHVGFIAQKKIKIGAKLNEYKPPIKRDCDINVPKQFATIQAGIDAAIDGDTVCVGKGTYNEDVLLNKSVHLSGKGAKKTIINGQTSAWPGTVYITAKNVIFEGFFVNGIGESTVQVDVKDSPHDAIIQYNWIKAGEGGMALQLDSIQNTQVENNIFEGNNSPYVVRESGGSSGKVDFLYNTFMGTVNPNERSDTGITLDASLPDGLIKWNVFNTTGTQIAMISPNGTSIINENNFNSDATLKVSNGWPTTVNAENNWWGDNDPSDNVVGSVDFTPFETKPFKESK